jgi:hypothetical protein
MVLQPKPFKVRFVPREEGKLGKWFEQSVERTKDL